MAGRMAGPQADTVELTAKFLKWMAALTSRSGTTPQDGHIHSRTDRGKNGVYAMEDAALAAFSVFYTQSPSFLAHQRAMEKTKGRSNAQSLFEMALIPTDAGIRKRLDPVDPQHVYPLFTQIFDALDAGGHIDPFRVKLDPLRARESAARARSPRDQPFGRQWA